MASLFRSIGRLIIPEGLDPVREASDLNPAGVDTRRPYQVQVTAPGQYGIPSAGIDPAARVVAVPGGKDPLSRRARLHELLHARFTPCKRSVAKLAKAWKVLPEALQVSEDLRVHALASVNAPEAWDAIRTTPGCAPLPGPDTDHVLAEVLKRIQVDPGFLESVGSEAITGAVGWYGISDDCEFPHKVPEIVSIWNREIGGFLDRLVDEAAEVARCRWRRARRDTVRDPKAHFQHHARLLARDVTRILASWRSGLKDLIAAAERGKGEAAKIARDAKSPIPVLPGAKWVPHQVLDLSSRLGVLVRKVQGLWRHVPTFTSARLRFPTRQDGQVCARRVRLPGIALLVDGSGSMCWTDDQLAGLLRVAPASFVAIYSSGGCQSRILVLARDGRSYSDPLGVWISHKPGQNNGCDGPALRFLGEEAIKRGLRPFWYSDGGINGACGASGDDLRCDALAVMRRFGIRRILNSGQRPGSLDIFTGLDLSSFRCVMSWRRLLAEGGFR